MAIRTTYNVFLFTFFCVLFSFSGRAQDIEYDEASIVYRQQIKGGVLMHSYGFGATFHYGTNLAFNKKLLLHADVLNFRHPREVRRFNPFFDDGRGYFYGKLNHFYAVRLGYGIKKNLFEKSRFGAVGISYTLTGGPSLGLVRPVYLEIVGPTLPFTSISTERYDPNRHSINNIYGRALGLRGFNDLQFEPGAFVKFGLNFEYSPVRVGVKALEVGVTLDAFLNEVPIMATEDNMQYFLGFYVTFQFGKNFNRR
ncbi:MAG: hypothetical protein ACXITV_03640 [Luteibaculaceae bacterium]